MTQNFSILVVDDTEENIDILVDILGDLYDVRVAMDGESALETVAEDPPGMILLDIMMPGMDGYQVCESLKANEVTQDIPVIFVTALEQDENETKGLGLGAVDYITKPFNPSIVKLRVENHCKLIMAKKELEKQNEVLKENARLRNDVENMARHDLKTPLNALISIPELLMKEENISSEQQEMLEMITQSGFRVMDIINSSVDLYKMEKGEYCLRPMPVDLIKVVRQMKGEISQLTSTKRVNIRLFIDGKPAEDDQMFFVYGEEMLFYSLFVNLIKNAVEASPDNEYVSIGFDIKQDVPIVLINNQGLVPEEIKDRFFEKNVTFGKPEGTGLGTYSAKLITKTLGGSLSYQSKLENGTTLIMRFPKNTETQADSFRVPNYAEGFFKNSHGQLEQFVKKTKSMTIMVVDDYPIMRGTIISILKQIGFKDFVRLSNGEQAMEHLNKKTVDLIFSDLNMPKMNGFEFLKELKKSKRLRNIPFVLVTADSESETVEQAALLGVSSYVVKPFSADVLIYKVGKVLEQKMGVSFQ